MYGKSSVFPFLSFVGFTKRIDGLSSLDALINALSELDKVCDAIEDKYLESLREDKFERWEEQR